MNRIIYIIIFSSFSILNLLGQNNQPDSMLNLKGVFHDGEVKLRWAIDSYEVGNDSRLDGFTLERYTYSIDSILLSMEERQASRTVLSYQLTPLEEEDWVSLPNQNNFKDLAKNLLYIDTIYSEAPDTVKLVDVVNNYQERNTAHVFGMYAADQDFETAQAMAMGYLDDDVQANAVYHYTLSTSRELEIKNEANFEAGWGSWAGGSTQIELNEDSIKANSGNYSVKLMGNNPNDYLESANIDISQYDEVEISFSFIGASYTQDDYFELWLSTDDGFSYNKIRHWYGDYHFYNDRRHNEVIRVDVENSNAVKFKFIHNGDEHAVGYIDDVVVTGINSPKHDLKATVVVNTSNDLTFEAPQIIASHGADKQVTLIWEEDPSLELMSYDIERSMDSVNFTKVNDERYVFMSTADSYEEISYKDSIPDNQTLFYYRIAGYNGFGVKTEYSNVIEAQGMEPPKLLFVNIDTTHFTDSTAFIQWRIEPDSLNNVINGFNVLISKNAKDGYAPFNQDTLGNEIRNFTLNNPFDVAYLKIEAYDDNDYKYQSIASYIQLKDTIPPAVPDITLAEFVSDQKFKVEWTASTDDDLQGYKVYHSNKSEGNFLELSPQIYKSTSATFEIDPMAMVDSVFIKVNAIDLRDNYSELSPYEGLSRPDHHSPNAPIITRIYPNPNGVEFSWKYSSSKDVKEHVLERKKVGHPAWEKILTIEKANEENYPTNGTAISWTDKDELDQQKYEYRFIAVDHSFNKVSSKLAYVKPFKKLLNGEISKVDVSLDAKPKSINWRVKKQLQNLAAAGISFDNKKEDETIYDVKINWEYDLTPKLKEFKVYRAITGGSMVLYRTINIAEAMQIQGGTVLITGDMGKRQFSFIDDNLMRNRTYVYQIMASHKDLTFSEKSSMVNISVPKN